MDSNGLEVDVWTPGLLRLTFGQQEVSTVQILFDVELCPFRQLLFVTMELVCCERRRGSKEMLYIAEMSKGKEDIATIGCQELHLKRKYSIAKMTIEGYSIT